MCEMNFTHLDSEPLSNFENFSNFSSTIECYLKFGCYLRNTLLMTAVISFFYVLIFWVGLIGNTITLLILSRNKSYKNEYNSFLINLAVADIGTLFFCLPSTMIGHIFGPWILGPYACKAVSYLQGTSVCTSIYSLVAIAIDRFLAICCHKKWQLSSSSSRLIIICIWIYSMFLNLPWAIYFRLVEIGRNTKNEPFFICTDIWPTENIEIAYFLVTNLGLYFIVPLLIIMVCYGFIWKKICKREAPGEGQHNNALIRKSKIKVIKMLAIVVLVFIASWLPLYIIFTIIKVGEPYPENSLEEQLLQVSVPIAQLLGVSNSCINPILYAFLSSKFREGFLAVLCRK